MLRRYENGICSRERVGHFFVELASSGRCIDAKDVCSACTEQCARLARVRMRIVKRKAKKCHARTAE